MRNFFASRPAARDRTWRQPDGSTLTLKAPKSHDYSAQSHYAYPPPMPPQTEYEPVYKMMTLLAREWSTDRVTFYLSGRRSAVRMCALALIPDGTYAPGSPYHRALTWLLDGDPRTTFTVSDGGVSFSGPFRLGD